MYQRSLRAVLKMESENVFVERVGNYPVVASTLGQVATLYLRCKDSSDLVKYSLETAENGVKLVTETVVPVVTKFGDGPIKSANTLACSQLDKLEHNYPLVTKPTEEVLEETKKLYEQTLKPGVDRIQSAGQQAVQRYTDAKQYGVEKYENVKHYGVEKYEDVKDYGVHTVNDWSQYSKQVAESIASAGKMHFNNLLESSQGKAVTAKLDGALECAETYLDKYLPEGEGEAEYEVDKAGKASVRLYNRAVREMKQLQMKSQETLDSLQQTLSLIEFARQNLDAVNNGLVNSARAVQNTGLHYWHEIRKEPHENGNGNENVERRAVVLVRHLTQKLRDSLYSINDVIVPNHLLDRLNEAREYVADMQRHTLWLFQTTKIDEFDQIFTTVKHRVSQVHDIVFHLADEAFSYWPLNKFVVNFEISEFDTDTNSDSEQSDIEMDNVLMNHRSNSVRHNNEE